MLEHATLLSHMAILTMQIVGLVYQWLSEGRRHRWQIEQRKAMGDLRADLQNGHSLT